MASCGARSDAVWLVAAVREILKRRVEAKAIESL